MNSIIFNQVELPKLPRSVFDLSYQNSFTTKFGQLTPCYIEDCIPGDKFKVSCAPFVRLEPLSAPIMGGLNVTVHYFFVPYRLVWENWEKFITGGRLGDSQPVMPYFAANSQSVSAYELSLFDYLGLINGQGVNGTTYYRPKVCALTWRAYWKIYDEYYRDQNLEDSLFDPDSGSPKISVGDGLVSADSVSKYLSPAFRAWRKDLFTSALPFAQRSGAPVSVPVSLGGNVRLKDSRSGAYGDIVATSENQLPSPYSVSLTSTASSLSGPLVVEADKASFNIEELRYANALQRWLERNAIAGSRYVEQILSHFGVRVPDYRLQRPEYLGGVTTPVMTSQVLQNSATDQSSPLGTMGGHGVSAGAMKPFTYKVKEHGCIMGILSIMPDNIYSQGVRRSNQKFDRMDFFFPEFQNLGEQAIMNSELFASGTAKDTETFGYAPRYYEYKTRENEVHGDFRGNLAYWIPQRKFTDLPALNNDFIKCDPNLDESLNNIFAVTDSENDPFYCTVTNVVRARRPMTRFSNFNF